MTLRLLGVVCLGAVLASAAIASAVLRTRWQARLLLEDVKRLDTNPDLSSSFSTFREEHRHQLVNGECQNGVCEYEFAVTNSVLSTLHLAPRTEMRARVTLSQRKIDAAGVEYTSAIFKENSPIVHVQEDFCADRTDIPCDHFALNPHGRSVAPAWNGDIEFGQLATAEQKAKAWALNLDCFAALYGCKDISQLSPTIWRATGPGVVSSRMRSTADSAAETAQPLSE